jgi:hypothetical protein
VERDEEHRVVVAKDLLRAVAVVDVPVDDCHPHEPELRLREPRRDGDVVEEAEPHRRGRPRVVARWADEREPAPPNRFDRRPRCEERRLEARLRGDRVGVEPDRVIDTPHDLDVLGRVAALEIGDGARRRLDDLELVQERGEPLRRLRMAEGRMEARERRMAYEVDRRTASASSPRSASPCARPTR